jgi:hypothetical protein
LEVEALVEELVIVVDLEEIHFLHLEHLMH